MKQIFHLSIHSHKGERKRWLNVYYSDKEKATTELKRWADKFRKEWQVPEKSNDEWDLDEEFTDETNIEIRNISKNLSYKDRYFFSGHVYEDVLIEEGEGVVGLCGEVFASGDNPDILFTNTSPLMDNSTSFSGGNPINMARKERSDFSQVSGGAVIQNEEKATEYYELRSKLIKEETHRASDK